MPQVFCVRPLITLCRQAGITHCFVNLGSDHPAIMEAITRGQRLHRDKFPEIITCPSEVCHESTWMVWRPIHLHAVDGRVVNGRWICASIWETAVRHRPR